MSKFTVWQRLEVYFPARVSLATRKPAGLRTNKIKLSVNERRRRVDDLIAPPAPCVRVCVGVFRMIRIPAVQEVHSHAIRKFSSSSLSVTGCSSSGKQASKDLTGVKPQESEFSPHVLGGVSRRKMVVQAFFFPTHHMWENLLTPRAAVERVRVYVTFDLL